MIAKLTGAVDSIGEAQVVIDVAGVGYLVYCSARTLGGLPPLGEVASLLVDTHVREDHIHLYGFADVQEREWFHLLKSVQGVGAKLAIAILSALSIDQLGHAIAAQDRTFLTRADGVGPKLASRILSELKDQAGDLTLDPVAVLAAGATGAAARGPASEAISALVNLGYRHSEASSAVAHAVRRLGPEASTEALIKTGLQEIGA